LGLEQNLQKNVAKKFSRFNINMMKVLHIKTFLATQGNDDEHHNYLSLSSIPRQHEEEDDDKQLLIVFCNTMKSKRKKLKPTKRGRV